MRRWLLLFDTPLEALFLPVGNKLSSSFSVSFPVVSSSTTLSPSSTFLIGVLGAFLRGVIRFLFGGIMATSKRYLLVLERIKYQVNLICKNTGFDKWDDYTSILASITKRV